MLPTSELYQLGFITIVICSILTALFAMTISSRVTEIWKTLLEWRAGENAKYYQNAGRSDDNSSSSTAGPTLPN